MDRDLTLVKNYNLILFLLGQNLVYPRLVLNLFHIQIWSWTLDFPVSTFQVLGLQICAIMPGLHGSGAWTQGLMWTRETLYQLSYIPIPVMWFLLMMDVQELDNLSSLMVISLWGYVFMWLQSGMHLLSWVCKARFLSAILLDSLRTWA